MSFQMRFVAYYFVAAVTFILVHHATVAQVLPDAKIKTNVSSLHNSLDYIRLLQPKRFEYNTHAYRSLNLPTGKYYGFMAEEFYRVFPYMVKNETLFIPVGKNTQHKQPAIIKNIELEKLVPVLVGAIQEQQAMIDELQQEVKTLKARQQIK